MLEFYQHLPEIISPIAISIGSFSIRWYSVMYLVAFMAVFFLLSYRIRKNENSAGIGKGNLPDLFIYLIAGLLVGARLGYVVFYNLDYYLHNPLEIIFPFSVTGYEFHITGIYGMSYYGGLVGVILAGWVFSKKQKARPVKSARSGMLASGEQFNGVNFWRLADFVVPAVPAGYFFGRIGNFLNGELYGRVTERFWGMYFAADNAVGNADLRSLQLRHPSQLYEAFLEGIVLFIILWVIRNRTRFPGYFFVIYLFGYSFFRFFVEFFREPDPQIELMRQIFTQGQFFSVIIVAFSVILYFYCRQREKKV